MSKDYDPFRDGPRELTPNFKKSAGFMKFDTRKPKFHLIDPFAHEDMAKVLTLGAEKYEENNWQKGDMLSYISAIERHLNAVKKGEYLDAETSEQHMSHIMCNAMFIHYLIRTNKTKRKRK